MKTFILTVKHDNGTGKFTIVATDEQAAKEMFMKSEKFMPESAIQKCEVLTEKRVIKTSIGSYSKAAKTKEHIYYVDFKESDETAGVLMFNTDMVLISNNYFAGEGLNEDIEEDKIIWASKEMKTIIEGLKKQILENA